MPTLDTTDSRSLADSATLSEFQSNTVESSLSCVAFDLTGRTAEEVFVVGSFNDWQVGANSMMPLGEGMWGVCIELPPGRYEYQFVVDGRWMPDPCGEQTVRNASGGVNSVVVVSP